MNDRMSKLPRLLNDLEPAAGVIKEDYEDFVVEETPLYEPSGEGTHTYFRIEKAGLSTVQAASDVAHVLNVRVRDIGYAGLKDARAVTRQWMSVEHVDPEKLKGIDIPRLKVLEVSRHRNKLKIGHLAANRFVIKVRHTQAARLAELQDGLARLSRKGMPNYFGHQRFGGRGDTWAVGQAMLRGQVEEAVDILLGRPSQRDVGDVARARKMYEKGQYRDAASAWPGMFRNERRALKALARTKGDRKRALYSIDGNSRRFYVSAYQSYLFNQVAAQRVAGGLGVLLEGDLACLHCSGAVFRVEDAAKEQPRADAFEISPTGPLYGYRMSDPGGRPGEIEADVLRAEELPEDVFRSGGIRVKGTRRALRVRPAGATIKLGADERGAYLELRFELPRGSYATSLLRELFVEGQGRELEASVAEQTDMLT